MTSSIKPSRRKPPTAPKEERDWLSISEFLAELDISYSTYRKLRAQGKMPQETALSRRTIRISKAAIKAWKTLEPPTAGQSSFSSAESTP